MGTSQDSQDVASRLESSETCHKNQRSSDLRQSAASKCHLYNNEDINKIWTDGRWKVSPFQAKKHDFQNDNAAQNLVNQSISIKTHKHLGGSLISATMIILLLLAPSHINESLCNANPSFLGPGHEITCEKGKEVSINDYIPIVDSSLNRCYTCSCPEGFIKCSRVEDSPDCMLPHTTGLKMKSRPAGANRFNPTSHHNHLSHHRSAIINNGKAKAIGGTTRKHPLKPTSPPVAQPIGGYSGSPFRVRSRSSNIVSPSVQEISSTSRYRHQQAEYADRADIPQSRMHEMFQPPALPLDDLRHIQIAADAMGVPLEQYRKILERNSRLASARTSTTPATTPPPTIEPTTEPITEPTTEPSTEPTTEPTSTTTSWASEMETSEWEDDSTSQSPDDGWTTTSTNVPEETTKESEHFEVTTQSPIWPPPENGLDAKSAPGPDDLTQEMRPNSPQYENEIMPPLTQDSMLYIAIGVEVFILVTILAMMVLFYVFRDKSVAREQESDIEYARGLRNVETPSRSPSIEKESSRCCPLVWPARGQSVEI